MGRSYAFFIRICLQSHLVFSSKKFCVEKMFNFVTLLILCYSIIDVHGANFQEHMKKVPAELMEMINKLHSTCMEQSGSSQKEFDDFQNCIINPRTPMVKYMLCAWNTVGIIDDDNALDEESFVDLSLEHLKAHNKKMVSACKFKTSTNEDELLDAVYDFAVCGCNLSPNDFFLP